MFAERQYWKDVADRFIKENVIVHPTRGNIISADGKLMASSLPEYKIYMDFKAGGEKKDTMLMNHLTEICEGLHQIFPDKSAKEFRQHILKGRRQKAGIIFSIHAVFLTLNTKKPRNYPYST